MKSPQVASVYLIGAGPGALDLLTVRAQRIIQQADLILYADSLVNPEIATLAKSDAEALGTASMALEEIVERIVQAARAGKLVARVHSGDPSVYGAIGEQIAALATAGIRVEIVPGVSSLFAAAAVLGVELTAPEVSQTVIISRAAGRTPVPEKEQLRSLAAHEATLAIFLSVGMIDKVVADLTAGGYPATTPVAVVYRATWPEERVIRGTLADIAATVRATGISRQALILVGEALRDANGTAPAARSRLYDPAFGHGFRASQDEVMSDAS